MKHKEWNNLWKAKSPLESLSPALQLVSQFFCQSGFEIEREYISNCSQINLLLSFLKFLDKWLHQIVAFFGS